MRKRKKNRIARFLFSGNESPPPPLHPEIPNLEQQGFIEISEQHIRVNWTDSVFINNVVFNLGSGCATGWTSTARPDLF